nr:hypothetical protein [Rhodococcus sp. (in: high G+C Gram-positive bacteria)]
MRRVSNGFLVSVVSTAQLAGDVSLFAAVLGLDVAAGGFFPAGESAAFIAVDDSVAVAVLGGNVGVAAAGIRGFVVVDARGVCP